MTYAKRQKKKFHDNIKFMIKIKAIKYNASHFADCLLLTASPLKSIKRIIRQTVSE
jgi:hypothetical protein